MQEETEKSQKTEAPTSKRIEDARRQGRVPLSRDVTAALVLGTITATIFLFGGAIAVSSATVLRGFFELSDDLKIDTVAAAMSLASGLIANLSWYLGPLFVALLIAPIAAAWAQVGPTASTARLAPQLSRLSPIAGMKRLASIQNLVEMAKGMAKVAAIGAACVFAAKGHLDAILRGSDAEPQVIAQLLGALVRDLLVYATIAMFVIAALDLAWQRYSWWRNLHMTRQELREELRHSEGNPEIKARTRALRRQRARRRMMAAVPEATVVITNPTHFAIALAYDRATMRAPRCVAKGQDAVARRIREVAEAHNIPLVENKPLAQTLYRSVEIDEEIPPAHYRAVAEVISHVLSLRRTRA